MHGTQNDAIVMGMAQTKERPYGLVSIDVHLNILPRWVIFDKEKKSYVIRNFGLFFYLKLKNESIYKFDEIMNYSQSK